VLTPVLLATLARMQTRLLTRTVVGSVVLVLGVGGLAACSSDTSSSSSNANQNFATNGDPASIFISQYGAGEPGEDSKVYTPFFVTGTKYSPNVAVAVAIFGKGGSASQSAVYSTTTTSSATGTISVQIPGPLAAGSYEATTTVNKVQVAAKKFQSMGANPRKPGTIHIAGKGVPGSLSYPVINNGNLYISQSANAGGIYRWPLTSLPTAPGAATALAPAGSWQPTVPDSVKMEQINFDNAGKNLLIAKKAISANVTGGNSVWSYPWTGTQTTGSGTQLIGNQEPAGNGFNTWGPGSGLNPNSTAAVANEYTSKNFPTTTPTKVSIGDGGGVVQAANGYYYFGSLQSGCVYKETADLKSASAVYCIPSWGAGGQNAATYTLTEDANGNVYAMYQGASDNNTIILKITPGGTGNDKVEALQLTGFARSVGLAVSPDGSKLWADGVGMDQYQTNNTNTILTVTKPVWGTPDKPTATKAAPTVLPGSATETWLTGMTYDQANNRLIIADYAGGFYINFL